MLQMVSLIAIRLSSDFVVVVVLWDWFKTDLMEIADSMTFGFKRWSSFCYERKRICAVDSHDKDTRI